MLTSKDSYFVDVRLLKNKLEEDRDIEANAEACIEWAFAGKSRTVAQQAKKLGEGQTSHTVWDHWIDSKSDNPDTDEGDMIEQENGDVLERGKNVNPETGEETVYEELWHDLEIESLGKKHNHSSVVMRAEDLDKGLKGMVVKVGGWCQGITKIGNDLTVERWEHKLGGLSGDKREALTSHSVSEAAADKTRNEWFRTFRSGTGFLPCKHIIAETSGRLGLNHVFKWPYNFPEKEVQWRVIEEYYW